MKRRAIFALMILLLLSGCGGNGTDEFEAWREALSQREELSFSAAVTAEGETTVFTCGMDAVYTGEETVVTVTAPETIEGLTFRRTLKGDQLEYDGAVLSLPSLGSDPAPCEAAPILVDALLRGELLYTGREDGLLTAGITAAHGETVTLWRTENEKTPVYAEISREGQAALTLRFSRWA